jgi:L-ribulokinase
VSTREQESRTERAEKRCTIGVDFGTESGRVLLLDAASGLELAVSVVSYAHGVIDRVLPGGQQPLPSDWALQDPQDWIAVLDAGIPAVLDQADLPGAQVVGLGIDFTSCTVLPAAADGTPLCMIDAWREHPHAWPKLWKHHAAQHVADRLNETALMRGDAFLERYGGRISSEWYFPKLIELWLEDRAVYDAAAAFLEATDWIVWYLTGRECRQSCTAGYKALWSATLGLPPTEFFEAAYPGFAAPSEKLGTSFAALGTRAGAVRPALAERLGLGQDVAVAVGNVDSFVSVPGAGVEQAGTFVMVIGTSICDMVVHPEEIRLPGITGVVADGILPGLYGYEAGQAAVGDMLSWFVERLARDAGGHGALEAAAATLSAGSTGLLAFDWWNGNRSILADADLPGVIVGLTLQSSAEHIYRALLEAIAFGNRRIIDNFEEHGIALSEIVACGGVAVRSPLLMQLLADTSGRPVHVPASNEIPARGAALFGAVAAGVFEDIRAAIAATRPPIAHTYVPDAAAHATYDAVYRIYRELYGLLGETHVELLHELKRIRTAAARS